MSPKHSLSSSKVVSSNSNNDDVRIKGKLNVRGRAVAQQTGRQHRQHFEN